MGRAFPGAPKAIPFGNDRKKSKGKKQRLRLPPKCWFCRPYGAWDFIGALSPGDVRRCAADSGRGYYGILCRCAAR